jgi:hypothetical protein
MSTCYLAVKLIPVAVKLIGHPHINLNQGGLTFEEILMNSNPKGEDVAVWIV